MAAVPFGVFAPLFAVKVFALHTVLGIHSLWPSAIMEAFENLSLARFAVGAGLILGAKVAGGLTAVKLWNAGRETIRKSPTLSKADDVFCAVGHYAHKVLEPVSAGIKTAVLALRSSLAPAYAKLRQNVKDAGAMLCGITFRASPEAKAPVSIPPVSAPTLSENLRPMPVTLKASVPPVTQSAPNSLQRFVAAGTEVLMPICRKIAAHRPARVLLSMDSGQKPWCLRLTR